MTSPVAQDLPPPMNHVFVDFENVHQINLKVIGDKSVCFTLLLGAKQKKLDVELVERLMQHSAAVQLVRLASSGKNALDFAISYYVGRTAVTDPTAYFHIISKDKGFDPLIEHLHSRHIKARRHDDFSTLTFSAPAKAAKPIEAAKAPSVELLNKAVEYLAKKKTNRPKKKKTLASDLRAHLGKTVSEKDVERVIRGLVSDRQIVIGANDGVTYALRHLGAVAS